jgi:hypothetical protein
MKVMWCWRCKMELPMLDEEEFAQFEAAHRECRSLKRYRERYPEDERVDLVKMFAPACASYTQMTGFVETNVLAVFHHRISIYGPPCPNCGKPFRTPQARFCAACGERRVANEDPTR